MRLQRVPQGASGVGIIEGQTGPRGSVPKKGLKKGREAERNVTWTDMVEA